MRRSLEQLLVGLEPVPDALGVVEAVDAEHEHLGIAQARADLAGALHDVRSLGELLEALEVDGDGDGGRAHPAVASLDGDDVALRADAQQLAAGAHEVARVGLALEAEEVGPEEAVEQLGAPRQLGEELDRREGDVVEPPDAHVGAQLAHEGRHELELVVLHPHAGTFGRHLGDGLGEALVDGLVARPPVTVEGGRHDDVVVDRPQRVVGEALVVVAHLVGRQRHGPQVDAVLVEGLRGLAGVTGPADPRAGLAAHHGLHGRDEPAGAAAPLDLTGVGDDLVDGQAVRCDDEVVGRPC